MTAFTLDLYAARSCPVKTFNEFDPTLALPELDHSLRESFGGGLELRQRTLDQVARESTDVLDLRDQRDLPAEERARMTLEAMAGGVAVIIDAMLPRDPVGHRRGKADMLVRDGVTREGRPAYRPVRVKSYRVLEKQLGCQDLLYSPTADLGTAHVLHDKRFRVFRQGVLLELSQLWRLLETCGHAATTPLGGIVGTDVHKGDVTDASLDSGDHVVWVRLDRRFLRTFSRTAPRGFRLRSALERYDHEHGFRVYVAEQAMLRTGVDDPEPPVRPIRVRECEWCPWWELCRTRMDDDDLSLRISKTPLDVRELQTLMSLGVSTVRELATADIDALLPRYRPLTTHRERSEQRLRIAAQRARMLMDGVELERTGTDPIGVPRAALEIDLDIETADGDITYLWGMLVTDRSTGEQHFEHFSKFAELTPDDEVEIAAQFARRLLELHAQHPDLRVYHYSDYETVHLRRLAERSRHPDLLAACEMIDEHFFDLFGPVRDEFVGTDGLGLKAVATKGAGFNWRDDEPGGLNSQTWFTEAVGADTELERKTARTRVLEYNEDDVRATWAVREWLTRLDNT